MKRLLKKRKSLATLLLLAIVIVPYLWSRVASVGRRVQLFETGATSPTAEYPFRVACYNIAHGRGLADSNWDGGDADSRLKRLDEIAALLRDIDADVVVLNEVDFDASWSNNVNQAEYLAAKAGYSFRVEERNLDFRVVWRTWRFGNAILSRYPISNPRVVDLPSYSWLETLVAGKKRGVAGEVQFGEDVFTVIGLHLSHRSETIREQSAQHVIERVKNSPHPYILLGDMNSTPPGLPASVSTNDGKNAIETFDESELFKRELPETPVPKDDLTFRSDDPGSIIDWILISDSLKFKSYEVVGSLLSDHRPLVADIDVDEAATSVSDVR